MSRYYKNGVRQDRARHESRGVDDVVELQTFKRKRLRQFARQQRKALDGFFCEFHHRNPLPSMRSLCLSPAPDFSGEYPAIPLLFSEDYLSFRDRLSSAVKIQQGDLLIKELKSETWFPRSLWPFEDDVIEWYISYLVLRLPDSHTLPYS